MFWLGLKDRRWLLSKIKSNGFSVLNQLTTTVFMFFSLFFWFNGIALFNCASKDNENKRLFLYSKRYKERTFHLILVASLHIPDDDETRLLLFFTLAFHRLCRYCLTQFHTNKWQKQVKNIYNALIIKGWKTVDT